MGIESFWNDGADRFMGIQHLSQERSLHPVLSKLIESCPGEKLLDYGCGDGRILKRLSERWTIDAYDPSSQMRAIARHKVGSRLRRLAADLKEVGGAYDVILLGMVILCIPEESEVIRVLGECAS